MLQQKVRIPDSNAVANTKNNFTSVTSKWGTDGNNGVESSNVKYNADGTISFTVDGASRTGAAIVSNDFYGPGLYEFEAKTTSTSGVCTAFWLYHNDGVNNYEIDIEMIKSNQILFSNWTLEDESGHTLDQQTLSYTISDNEYHKYAFEWNGSTYTKFYVDGDLVATLTNNVPTHNMKLWIGSWCPSWAGEATNEVSVMTLKSFDYTPIDTSEEVVYSNIINLPTADVVAFTYDGNSHSPEYVIKDSNGNVVDKANYTVHFVNESGYDSSEAPTEKGWYSVTFQLADGYTFTDGSTYKWINFHID